MKIPKKNKKLFNNLKYSKNNNKKKKWKQKDSNMLKNKENNRMN